jgi:hypothetical protein
LKYKNIDIKIETMKKKIFILILNITFYIASCVPTIKTDSSEIANSINTTIPTTISTVFPTATITKTPENTATPYPSKGTCPLNLSQEGVYFFAGYDSNNHLGIDIAAPEGTQHISPGDCEILYFYIQDDGGQGVQLRCANLPSVDRITLHHIDLSQHDFETLDYYGILKSDVFNDDGSVKTVEFGFNIPNSYTNWGENLHIYSGNTGKSGLPHTHITIWTLNNGELDDHNNPIEYLDCQE